MCIHRGDPTICKSCNKTREEIIWKTSDKQRIEKYHDEIQEKKSRGHQYRIFKELT